MPQIPQPRIWNFWFTLMVISAVFTAIVLLLEGLGVFRDWGMVLSGFGLLATLTFGVTASTRASVNVLTSQISQIHMTLQAILDALQRIEQKLP